VSNPAIALICAFCTQLIGGIETGGAWPSVYQIKIGPDGGSYCSSVFIDHEWALTAAHCLRSDSEDGVDVDHADVRILAPEKDPENTGVRGIFAKEIIIHEKYGSGVDPDYDHDVALIRFPSDPSRITSLISRVRPAIGEKITIVGFGRKVESRWQSGGTKRVGQNIVREFDGSHVRIKTRGHPPDVDTVILGSGDSGGPWFNSMGQIIAISSLGTMQSSSGVMTSDREILSFITKHVPIESAQQGVGVSR
jgi:hypothetical protein